MFLIKLNIYFSIILYFSGMTLTSGTCTLKKDAQNLVGISIGGGYSTLSLFIYCSNI